jgi:hypothetical protein
MSIRIRIRRTRKEGWKMGGNGGLSLACVLLPKGTEEEKTLPARLRCFLLLISAWAAHILHAVLWLDFGDLLCSAGGQTWRSSLLLVYCYFASTRVCSADLVSERRVLQYVVICTVDLFQEKSILYHGSTTSRLWSCAYAKVSDDVSKRYDILATKSFENALIIVVKRRVYWTRFSTTASIIGSCGSVWKMETTGNNPTWKKI